MATYAPGTSLSTGAEPRVLEQRLPSLIERHMQGPGPLTLQNLGGPMQLPVLTACSRLNTFILQVTSYADKRPPTFSPNCALGKPNACCSVNGGADCYR